MTIPSTPGSQGRPNTSGKPKFVRLSALQHVWPKLIGLAVWLAALVAYWQYTHTNSLTPQQTVQHLVEFLAGNRLGVFVYILAYVLRPLLFFPATLVTMAAGYLYGPFYGTAIVIVASNLSSMVAYYVGRFFGAGILDRSTKPGIVQTYAERLRRSSFETALIMRFLFLPYDLVSYFAGFLRVNPLAFLLATVLGSIPGTISFILFGAALQSGFTGALPRLNPWSLGLAALMFVVSLGFSRWFRQREARRAQVSSGGSQCGTYPTIGIAPVAINPDTKQGETQPCQKRPF